MNERARSTLGLHAGRGYVPLLLAALTGAFAFAACSSGDDDEGAASGGSGGSGAGSAGTTSGSRGGSSASPGKGGAGEGGASGEPGVGANHGGEAGGDSRGGADGGGTASGGSGGSSHSGGGTTSTGGTGGDANGGAAGETSAGRARVKQLGAGYSFSCALLESGTVKCWGDDSYGTLGNGAAETETKLSAVDVVGLGRAKRIEVSGSTACAIKEDDTVLCWGFNERQELVLAGDARIADEPVPLKGFVDEPASDVTLCYDYSSGTSHGCVIQDGAIGCWGQNGRGQLGYTTPKSTDTVTFPDSLTGYLSVVGGESFSCGITTEHGVRCWGDREYGQLGDGDGGNLAKPSAVPVDVIGLTAGVKQLVAGARTACALTDAGAVKCWGSYSYGALGASTDYGVLAANVGVPMDVVGLDSGVVEIAAGLMSFCALLEDHTMQCWGYDQNGQLGDQPASIGVNQSELTPVEVKGLTDVATMAVGTSHTCAALTTGGVKCWGADTPSGVDLLTNQLEPVYIEGI